ncbi:hypothetical protein IAU60_002233 [Kwoniella sp. DSM 27419]
MLIQRRKAVRSVEQVVEDLRRLQELRHTAEQASLKAPDPLRLRNAFDARPTHDWESKLRERFIDFFRAAGHAPHALNSFLVMQARQALLAQLAVDPGPAEPEEQAEDIACELLNGLNSLPVECVATNGPSLVQKADGRGLHQLEIFLSVLSVIEGTYTFGKDILSD